MAEEGWWCVRVLLCQASPCTVMSGTQCGFSCRNIGSCSESKQATATQFYTFTDRRATLSFFRHYHGNPYLARMPNRPLPSLALSDALEGTCWRQPRYGLAQGSMDALITIRRVTQELNRSKRPPLSSALARPRISTWHPVRRQRPTLFVALALSRWRDLLTRPIGVSSLKRRKRAAAPLCGPQRRRLG